MVVLSALLALTCLSCTDRNPHLPDAAVAMEVTPVLRCLVDVRSGNVSCTEEGPLTADGASYALLGNASVKLRSANNSYDSLSLVYGFDVTVQNLLKYDIGTPDGQTRAGVKVFFERVPHVTAYKSPGDTGTVELTNHDGTQNFTGANQPYFFYDTILPPQGVTSAKRWEFRMPRTVQSFGFSVRVFTATSQERRVPNQAPEGRPRWFYALENSRPCTGLMAGPCLPNVVTIQFTASASQEERQSAIDMIGGKVVGGTLGAYHVEIPRDTTMKNLRDAVEQLRKLPQAQYVAPFSTAVGTVDYLRPTDGTGFTKWQMNPDSADSENWALEQIAAPMAWGCSVGDDATRIAIVDDGFFSVSDIDRQARTSTRGYPSTGSTNDDHGTRVTSVAAGYGNDTSLVSGVMWRANLILRDAAKDSLGARFLPVGLPINELWPHVRAAGRAGARVINLSLGWRWNTNPATETDSLKRLENQALLADWYRNFKLSMDSLAAENHRPLIVFSAGNQGAMGVDASWNVARIAADSSDQFGQRYNVLVVGASTRAQTLGSFTNRGPLVTVAAPGASVVVVHGNARVDSIDPGRSAPHYTSTGSGTSFAAPHVSGLAGLLFAFDPRLTADTVKQLILEGAQRGGRTAGGIPIINAHESLILAARRPGAPLCGNRMWIADGNFYAQRDTASPTGEVLFPAPASGRSSTVAFNAMHGGKEIMFYSRPTRTGRQWSASGWTTIAFSDTGPANGAFLSRAGQSHDQDSTVILEQEPGALRTVTWRPVVRTAGGEVRLPNVITDSLYDDPGLCLSRFVEVPAGRHSDLVDDDNPQLRDAYLDWRQRVGYPGNCTLVGPPRASAETLQFLAYAPVGQQAYVFIVRRRTTTSPTGSRACTRAAGLYTPGGTHLGTVFYTAECIEAATVTASAGTAAYRINVPGGAITPLSWAESSYEVWSPMIRENGRELLVERQNYRATTSSHWEDDYGGVAQLKSPAAATGECILQFRDLQTGTVKLSPGTCFGSSGGQGGFSAVRSPGT